MDASEIHPRRLNAKEVLTPQREEYLRFPKADGTAKLSGRDHELREPTQSEKENVEANRESVNGQNQKMTLKPRKTSGRFKATSSDVTTWNLEFNSTCRRKNIPYSTEIH